MQLNNHEYVRAIMLLTMTGIIGIGGVMLVGSVIAAWRRSQNRHHFRKGGRKPMMPDIWQAGGDRLMVRFNQEEFRRRAENGEFKNEGDEPDDDGPDGDEDDQDTTKP
ncbi:MAG: hypothetical protein IT441_00550 [Phycisphaeraceae bacterium]|nr:hypothetical protein [Phycisphaeraceae bacterium]